MRAGQFFTQADEQAGYQRTRECLRSYSDRELISTYHETLRDTFDCVFGHNARCFFNLVADELIRRGITQLPNIFGPIEVRHVTS